MTALSPTPAVASDRPAVAVSAPLILSFGLAGLAAWLSLFWMASNVDVSWYLIVGARLLDGARLYHDIVEVNPPFSVWLYLPLLLFERASDIRAEVALAVALPLLAMASILVSARILRCAGWFDQAWTVWLLPVAVWTMAFLFPGDFGQREQIAAIVLLPWLALLAARDRSPVFAAGNAAEIVVAGLGAAVFVMIKPPMAAVSLILPALYVAVARRSLRPFFTPETLIGAAVTIAYLGWLAVFHQDYFLVVLPMLREFYMASRLPLVEMLGQWPTIAFASLAAAAFVVKGDRSLDRATLVTLLAGLGYIPGYLLMGKGWSHHAIPFLLFGLVAFLIQVASHKPTDSLSAARKTAIGAVAAMAAIFFVQSLTIQWPPIKMDMADLAHRAGPTPTVMSIAADFQPAHPLTRNIRGQYVARYPALWRVHNAERLAAREADPARRAALLETRDRDIAEAAAEIVRLQPDLVMAGGSVPVPGEATIMSDQAIVAALKSYRQLYQDAGTTVFVRTAP